jgi:hypothetical protein
MEGELVATGGGRCPVCGQATDRELWSCSRCRTPHHKDCAEYFGGCAIFGCRDSRPPDRMERAAWPAVLKHLETLTKYRRSQAVTAFWFGTSLLAVFLAFFLGDALRGIISRGWIETIQMAIGLYSFLGVIAAGPAWLFTELLGVVPVTRRLERELGRERSSRIQIPSSTMARGIPRLKAASILSKFRWAGYVLFVGSIAFGFLTRDLGGAVMVVGMLGVMPVVSILLLSTYLDENELYVRRIRASFAPLPGKSSGRIQIGEKQ